MLIKSQSGKQIVNFDKYNGICIGYPNESDFKIYAVLEVDSEHISQVELGYILLKIRHKRFWTGFWTVTA